MVIPEWFWAVAVLGAVVGAVHTVLRRRWLPLLAVLVWSVAAILVVAVLALLWLTLAAVAWAVNQPDWVTKVGALGPLATALAAAVAFAIGLATVAQKWRADRRDQWWKRAQWSLEAAIATGDDNADRRRVGQSAITYLGRSSGLRARDDILFLRAAVPSDTVLEVTQRLEAVRSQEGMPYADVDVELVDDDSPVDETGPRSTQSAREGGRHDDPDRATGARSRDRP